MSGRPPLNVGIIGCGHAGATWANAVAATPAFRLRAVLDCVSSQAQRLSAQFEASIYANEEQLIDDSDLVIVCTPHSTHRQIASCVLDRRRFLLCEKPCGISTDDAVAVALHPNAERSCVAFHNRFNASVEQLLSEFERHAATIREVNAQVVWPREPEYYARSNWRGNRHLEGGIALNQGIHVVDLIVRLVASCQVSNGRAVRSTLTHTSIETEDTLVLTGTLGPSHARFSCLITTAHVATAPHTILLVASETKAMCVYGRSFECIAPMAANIAMDVARARAPRQRLLDEVHRVMARDRVSELLATPADAVLAHRFVKRFDDARRSVAV